jgi:phosphoglycolate phosphatase-like HAD superfamily hydrolase
MASAGLCFDAYPVASGDDALDRESIVRLSMQRAAERYGPFASAVYVGDGVWDARTCRQLGFPFIGVAPTGHAARLLAEGAVCVFPDLADTEEFLNRLHEITNRS